MIIKEGNNYIVKSETGKVLGKHKTRKKAIAQLQAIEISKHNPMKLYSK